MSGTIAERRAFQLGRLEVAVELYLDAVRLAAEHPESQFFKDTLALRLERLKRVHEEGIDARAERLGLRGPAGGVRSEWSCEGCGKPTRDEPSACECGCDSSVCQVCWHGPEPACQGGAL